MIYPFRELSGPEQALWSAAIEAHYRSAFRDNASTHLVRGVSESSGSYGQALIAALASLGGKHAPLKQTIAVLQSSLPEIEERIKNGVKVPGWGNSFVKGRPDALWDRVDRALREVSPDIAARIDAITEAFHAAGKDIYPNPSAYTAAVALGLRMPPGVVDYIFVAGRLPAWTQLAAETL